MYENDVLRRNESRRFKTVLAIDICLMLSLLVILPYLASSKLAWGIVLASMLAAILPDSVWVYRFIDEVKTRQWKPGHWSSRFHQAIQWYEQPVGLIVEIGWLGAMIDIYFFEANCMTIITPDIDNRISQRTIKSILRSTTMNVTTISEFRKNAKQYLDKVVNDQDILIISRGEGRSVIAMPLDRYNDFSETEYLLSSPINAARLKRGIAEAKAGKTIKKTMEELKQYE